MAASAADTVAALAQFIDASPSPAHVAASLARELAQAGFVRLSLGDAAWPAAQNAASGTSSAGGFFVQRGAAVIAWVQPPSAPQRLRLIGAHVDSPHLRLKPRPAFACEGCAQLGVEVYGGVLLNSWLDRELGLAGSVHTTAGEHLVRIDQPIARVPQLAIHLDRKINDDGLKLNPQTQLAPIFGLAGTRTPEDEFNALIAAAAGVPVGSILGHDLSLFELAPARRLGLPGSDGYGELLVAPRLDNLSSCHAGLVALCAHAASSTGVSTSGASAPGISAKNSAHPAEPVPTLAVLACLDHEEVGSTSASGADGVFLAHVLERIALALGLDRAATLALFAEGFLISADTAHAVHPNYADRHEPRHRPRLGGGPVLKTNHNQRYATSGATAARVRALAAAAGVPLQDFVTRSDLGCGSTIGPACAAQLGMQVADIGTPILSMHSIRELQAAADHPALIALLRQHLLS